MVFVLNPARGTGGLRRRDFLSLMMVMMMIKDDYDDDNDDDNDGYNRCSKENDAGTLL